ncbi:branched-chain amino acid transporter permease [Leucobacter luti]|uniref:branched-chain amino acid transporter permease n=1 Tax=Leucobacter luti TaxID=340320 RepID=UPI003CFFEEE5
MSETSYLLLAVLIGGAITLGLRALPFAILKPLRRSRFVKSLGAWMPAGILLILAVVVVRDEIVARPGQLWIVASAVVVTVCTHLFAGRRALLSIAAGTTVYVALLNLL